MTDEQMKLSEAEIIKALDCCDEGDCRNCPLRNDPACKSLLIEYEPKDNESDGSKTTDEQIIKALELCIEYEYYCPHDCPLYSMDFPDETCPVSKEALDLINRQKTEIESLKIANEKMYVVNKEQEAEIDELQEILGGTAKVQSQTCAVVRVDAIKEFAQRLKDIYESDKRYDRPNAHTLVDKLFANIDNLVKEMTEQKG